ncbi:hypothetical protein MTR67_027752 [Solanum verrucosum]|uniref:Retrotransposon gag domain-containing protein n=1 Tax=Solanum verrucosum TaxID=315347 RepID=A0AAF0R5Q1_SOLVR|nr:hypothetical protein MTR67_027752 [Solanum verrucosum]
MLSQAITNQLGQRENQQEVVDTSRIREFLRMNPPSFTCSSVTEDPENFVEELQKGVARIWFDQWKKNRAEVSPLVSWSMFEEAFLECFFPCELTEVKYEDSPLKLLNVDRELIYA